MALSKIALKVGTFDAEIDDHEMSEVQSDSEMFVDENSSESKDISIANDTDFEKDSDTDNKSSDSGQLADAEENGSFNEDIEGSFNEDGYRSEEDAEDSSSEVSNKSSNENAEETLNEYAEESSNDDWEKSSIDTSIQHSNVTDSGGNDYDSTYSELSHEKNIFPLNMYAGPRGKQMLNKTVRKIKYRETSVIGVGEGVKVYEGKFEGNVKVAIKKVAVDANDIGTVADELTNLQLKLNKTVRINQQIMAIGNDNVVKYFCHEFDLVNQQVHLLLALELCDRNLHQFIQDRSKLPTVLDKDIFIQLSSGLHFLHSRKIVHRDLKPSNVLLKIESNGKVTFKLSDFGVSKSPTDSESSTSMSGPCGTYGWTAPEVYTDDAKKQIMRSVRFRKKSDIFPLGQIFYYIASNGRSVFRNKEAIQKNVADLRHIPRGKQTLLYLIRDMLAHNYENRPCTGQILNHPALWTTRKTLEFLHTASKLLEKEPNGCPIESDSSNILRGDWQQHLSQAVERHLFPTVRGQPYKKCRLGPNYKRKSVQSLLRAIRNNKEHFVETTKSPDLKNEFGSYPAQFLAYWTSRFPELLVHTYTAIELSYRTHDLMEDFY